MHENYVSCIWKSSSDPLKQVNEKIENRQYTVFDEGPVRNSTISVEQPETPQVLQDSAQTNAYPTIVVTKIQ